MVPGLALFYGGLVRKRAVLNTFMMSVAALAVVTVQWVVIGYSLSFGPGAIIGEPAGSGWTASAARPDPYSRDDSTCRVRRYSRRCSRAITVALISGAMVERMRFQAYLVVRGSCGRRSCTIRSRTGCGRATAGCADSARSTSPVAPWCTSAPAPPRSSRRLILGRRRVVGRTPLVRTLVFRSRAPGCCGSVGSASTPARRSRPTVAATALSTTHAAAAAASRRGS